MNDGSESGERQNRTTFLKEHIFSAEHPHWVSLISGVTSGLGAAIAIEWKDLFEGTRSVPIWETILVAVISTSGALWGVYFLLSMLQKVRKRAP